MANKFTFNALTGKFDLITSSLSSSSLTIPYITGATNTTLQSVYNNFLSTGVYSGFTITDNSDGTVAIASGNGMIRAADSIDSTLYSVTVSAVSSLALTNNDTNYLYVEYNSGSPQIVATTTLRTDLNTNIYLGLVYREGTVAHIYQPKRILVSNYPSLAEQRFQTLDSFAHESGAIMSEVSSLYLSITAGAFWEGVERFTTAAFNSSGSDRFTTYYRDGGSGWTATTGQAQIDNTYYDDGTGTLHALTSNKYSTRWVYLEADGNVDVIYGTSHTTLVAAVDEGSPSSLPEKVSSHSRLIGKIIIQQGTSSFVAIYSAFETFFEAAVPTVHNELSGLQGGTTDQYYHLTSSEYTGTGSGVFVRKTNASLTTPTMDYGYFTQYPHTQPDTDFYFNNLQVLTFGWDEFANIDGSSAGFTWSNFDSGDGELQLRTIGNTYLNLRVNTLHSVSLTGDGSGITNLSPGALSSVVPINKGGTNKALTLDAGAVVWTDADSFELTAAGSSGQILRSGGTTTPTWSTATYPATAGTSGKILISDGTNIVSSTPTYPNSASTSGKILQSNGTNLVMSTPTYPSSASTAGKIIRSDGTNLVMSTATYPNNVTSNNILYATGTDAVGSSATFKYDGTTFAHTGGVTQLNNGTSNRIEFGTNGVAAPGASSAGMKIKLYGTNGAMATTDYAIGIEASTMWFNTGTNYKFYQGGTLAVYYQGSSTSVLQCWGINNGSPIGRLDVVGGNGTANTNGQAAIVSTAGNGGTSSNASAAGTGGYCYMFAGNGGAATSTGPGGNGGYFTMTGGQGGDNNSTGNGGNGGQFTFSGGLGGSKSAGASGNAGVGGAFYLYGGNGGDTLTTVSGTAGNGGGITFAGGNGGGMYVRAAAAAQGGHCTITGGTGGLGSAGGSTGGAGGNVYVQGGVGGDLDSGSTYGNGGHVYIDGGPVSGAANIGNIFIGSAYGYVSIGTTTTPDVKCVISNADTTAMGLRVENTQVNVNAFARIHARSSGASGGDAFSLYEINAVTSYSIGIDNSDSDKLKFVVGANPSAATGFLEVDTNGTTVFNENGTSTQDFRIEGDTKANCFFLDSSADAVGFNVAAPVTAIHMGGSMTYEEQSGTPSNPTSGTQMRVYMKADKFIIQFNDAGTIRYKYLDLTSTGVTWVHTTVAP